MPQAWTWDQLITEFRTLGGIADNICLKEGSIGRGIFPLDPAKPVMVRTPKNLLIAVDKITFDNGAMLIKKDASDIGSREKTFFEAYQKDFSWGDGGRDDCIAFVSAMDKLPDSLRDLLTREFGLTSMFQGSQEERVQKRFLRSRMINSQNRRVIMPMVDLINHGSDAAGYDSQDGVTVKGTFSDEVLVRYNITDAFSMFITWNFASDEPLAYSLPMRVPLGSRRLVIHRNFVDKAKIGNVGGPTVKIDVNNLVLSHLLLGHMKFPKLAKSIFHRVMKDQSVEREQAEEAWDRIQHFNRMKFLKLRAALDHYDGPAASTLQKVAQYQLMAQSHHVGERPL